LLAIWIIGSLPYICARKILNLDYYESFILFDVYLFILRRLNGGLQLVAFANAGDGNSLRNRCVG
ncbi:MAG: hypothetical protein LBD28_00720, partial [Tannerellaceae bacterium]|jgi:hypothetical protein|nr:hypothetical protein [Tannerellaceae bacterium]